MALSFIDSQPDLEVEQSEDKQNIQGIQLTEATTHSTYTQKTYNKIPRSIHDDKNKHQTNVYIAAYRIIILSLLLYCIVGVTYLLFFKINKCECVTYEPAITSNMPTKLPSYSPTSIPIDEYTSSQNWVGDYKISTQNKSHLQWLLCDGSEIDLRDYPLLYDLIGVQFGAGSNQWMFKLPNPLNNVIGIVSEKDDHYLGDVDGSENITLSYSQLPSHYHYIAYDDGTLNVCQGLPTDYQYLAADCNIASYTQGHGTNWFDRNYGLAAASSAPNTFQTSSVGGTTEINILQPTLYAGNLFIYGG